MDIKDIREHIVGTNRISPFPRCREEDFDLKQTFFLPQDLEALRELTGIEDLNWAFDEKPLEQRGMYRKAYQQPYTSSLGLLFYRKLDFRVVGLLPNFWFEHRLRGYMEDEEIEYWERILEYIYETQHLFFSMEQFNKEYKGV